LRLIPIAHLAQKSLADFRSVLPAHNLRKSTSVHHLFTGFLQGVLLKMLDFLVNGGLKIGLEGFCSAIELHPRRDCTRPTTAEYNIYTRRSKNRSNSS
jgi:hypothetical protein